MSIILGLISLVCFGLILTFGEKVKTIFGQTSESITSSESSNLPSEPGSSSGGSSGTSNQPPVWSVSSGVLAKVISGQEYSESVAFATDPDGDTVSYSLISGSLPGGVSLTSSGEILGTPTLSSESSFALRVRASDGKGGYSDYSFGIPTGTGSYQYYRVYFDAGSPYGSNVQIDDLRFKTQSGTLYPPVMTGPTMGIYSASTTSNYDSYTEAWRAFDADTLSGYISADTYSNGVVHGHTPSLTINMGAKIPAEFLIMKTDGNMPTAFRLYGSNDSSFSRQRLLLSQSGVSWPSSEQQWAFGEITQNTAPVWQTSESLSFSSNISVSMNFLSSDPDGDEVFYSVVSGSFPEGLSFINGQLSGSTSFEGESRVTLRAQDSYGYFSDRTFVLTFQKVGYRYYQVELQGNYGWDTVQLRDFRFKTQSGYLPQNMTSNSSGGVTVSQACNPSMAYFIFDSDVDSRWYCFQKVSNIFNVDMGSEIFPTHVKLITANGSGQAPGRVLVYGSKNADFSGRVLLFDRSGMGSPDVKEYSLSQPS